MNGDDGMTDTTRVPGGGEDRVAECPVCSNVMTKMEAEGVTDGWPLSS
jgi:hypothetical protein